MREGDAEKRGENPTRSQEASGGTAQNPGSVHQARAACDGKAGEETSMLMKEVLRRENMIEAYNRVVRNKGAPGIDEMTVDDLKSLLAEALGANPRIPAQQKLSPPTGKEGQDSQTGREGRTCAGHPDRSGSFDPTGPASSDAAYL